MTSLAPSQLEVSPEHRRVCALLCGRGVGEVCTVAGVVCLPVCLRSGGFLSCSLRASDQRGKLGAPRRKRTVLHLTEEMKGSFFPFSGNPEEKEVQCSVYSVITGQGRGLCSDQHFFFLS